MADDTLRIAGTAFLSVDGQTLPLAGEFEYCPSTVGRKPLPGMDGIHGYSESPIPGWIKGTIRDAGGLKISDLNDMTGVTVVCVLANGKTVTGRNMWTNGEEGQSGKSTEATIEVEWYGVQGSVTERTTRTAITVGS